MPRDANLAACIDAAHLLPLPDPQQHQAARIAWTASNGEGNGYLYANDGTSTLNKYGNGPLTDQERAVARESLNYPHDAVGRNLDSMGMVQQRPSADWGPPADLMNPAVSFSKFFNGAGYNKGLLDVPNWDTIPIDEACWQVQQCRKEDMWVYTQQIPKATAEVDAAWTTPPDPDDEPPEHDYATYQPDSGPDASAVWIAAPGVFAPLPTQEYYDTLVRYGAALPVQSVTPREFDILRDSYLRWPPPAGPTDVWDHDITSLVTGTPYSAADLLAYTNLHTEP